MTQRRNRQRNQSQPNKESQSASGQPALPPVPPLIEGAEPKIIYYKPEEDEYMPKHPWLRRLYHHSQIILSALTLAVVVLAGVVWYEGRRTREIENRAYVATQAAGILASQDNPGYNSIYVNCVNAGKTPGINGYILAILESREASPPEDTVVNPPERPASRFIFGPGITISRVVGLMPDPAPPVTAQAGTETARNGQVALPKSAPTPIPTPTPLPTPKEPEGKMWYVFGVIVYDDIFGETHRTKFCYRNIPGTGTWWYCPTYNHAD